MENNEYYVYIVTNWNNRVMYIGMTNNLQRRIYEHKNKLTRRFMERYNVSKLVYFEITGNVESVILREKKLKNGEEKRRINWLN